MSNPGVSFRLESFEACDVPPSFSHVPPSFGRAQSLFHVPPAPPSSLASVAEAERPRAASDRPSRLGSAYSTNCYSTNSNGAAGEPAVPPPPMLPSHSVASVDAQHGAMERAISLDLPAPNGPELSEASAATPRPLASFRREPPPADRSRVLSLDALQVTQVTCVTYITYAAYVTCLTRT